MIYYFSQNTAHSASPSPATDGGALRKVLDSMRQLNPFSALTTGTIRQIAQTFGTPVYAYDERLIEEKCRAVLSMPNAFGHTSRYAMKANSNRMLLRIIHAQGMHIDASSLNEVRRAVLAGIPYEHILLTTQEVPLGEDRTDLQAMLLKGLQYTVASLRQLTLVAPFAAQHGISLSMRIHPGVGSGESATRNTGDHYSCFGVHLTNLQEALDIATKHGVRFTRVHTHIGSGGDPEVWRSNIDLELGILERHFPDAHIINFGGGLKEARMPGESKADIALLGEYAKQLIEAFYAKTGRKLHMETEPGTYIMANAGYIITEVLDKKSTGEGGFHFLVADGGMNLNARPAMYGSRHPIYLVSSRDGSLISSEYDPQTLASGYDAVVAGPCCESGDAQTLDAEGLSEARVMAEPNIGDFLVIGGAGAYCAAMTPFNYNTHLQAAEILFTREGNLKLIRKQQTLEQIVQNEV